MSKLIREVLDLTMNEHLKQNMNMTFPAYLDWINSHILENQDFDTTKDFLSLLGLHLFIMWKDKIPALTLDDVAAQVFTEDNTDSFYVSTSH